jgi:hypothetical protein
MNDTPMDAWETPPAPAQSPAPPQRRGRIRAKTATMATLVGLAGGGLVGGYAISQAATSTPTPSPTTTPGGASSAGSGSAAAPGTPGDADHGRGGPGGLGALGGSGDRAEDDQTVATAIGISVTQLQTELQADKTIAAVAKAHNVDPNTVIAALVAAQNKEIDAALAAGSITQAQADQDKAAATQAATDRVNGTRPAGSPGGRDDHGGPPDAPGAGSSSSSTSSAGV